MSRVARRVERLNEVRYRSGSTSLKVWLDSQETRRQAEASYAETLLNARQAQITLFKALGGDDGSAYGPSVSAS